MLEDDLDIMVDLCKALVKLHPILIPLDFKSCGTAWKVYVSFVKEYQERLAERLSQRGAIEVLAAAIVANFRNLHCLGRGEEEGANDNIYMQHDTSARIMEKETEEKTPM